MSSNGYDKLDKVCVNRLIVAIVANLDVKTGSRLGSISFSNRNCAFNLTWVVTQVCWLLIAEFSERATIQGLCLNNTYSNIKYIY